MLVARVFHALPVEGHGAGGDAETGGGGRMAVDSEEEAGVKAITLKKVNGCAEVVGGKRRAGRDGLRR